MRRLSDSLFQDFPRRLENILKSVRNVIEEKEELKRDFKWEELPKPENCSVYGIDGSRSMEKRCGAIVYAVSSVGVGEKILELHDISVIEPFKHVEKRIEMHMQTNEARIGLFSDGLALLDGSLSNLLFLIEKPRLTELYGIENEINLSDDKTIVTLQDFKNELDEWLEGMKRDIESGLTQRKTLLSRDKEKMRIALEFVEYLHAYDRLLEKEVVSIAKNVYESRLLRENDYRITDQAVVDYLVNESFGFEKSGYFKFSYEIKKGGWVRELAKILELKNLIKLKVHPCYIRFRDYGNIYLLESNVEIEKVLPRVVGLEVDGYPFPLVHAHRYSEIKRREMKAIMIALMNALADRTEFRILLKHPRSNLERFY